MSTPPSRAVGALERLGPLLAAGLFVAALAALHRELASYTYHDIVHAAGAVPGGRLAGALGLTALGYAVLPGYDAMALAYIRHPLQLRRTAFGSFIAYAFSQTLGTPLLSGGSVRYRLWSSWGLSSAEIGRAVGFVAFSFLLGMLAVSGVVFVLEPAGAGTLIGLPPGALRPLGAAQLALIAVYAGWSLRGGGVIRLGRWRLAVPAPVIVGAQILVAALDWTLAGAALYVLLPAGHGIGFLPFLGIFLLAQFAGLASHVPAGLGVTDALLVLLLRPFVPTSVLLGALIVYRVVYYLLPFGLGYSWAGTSCGFTCLARWAQPGWWAAGSPGWCPRFSRGRSSSPAPSCWSRGPPRRCRAGWPGLTRCYHSASSS